MVENLKKQPLVSVVIPVYNRESFIQKTVQCVLNQTYHHFELLLVDDCSLDNSVKIIQEIIQHDKRVKLLQHTNNQGAPAARNTGIAHAKGKYLALLDSDDLWEPKKLELQVNQLESSLTEKICFTGVKVCRMDQQGTLHKEGEYATSHKGWLYPLVLEGLPKGCLIQGMLVELELARKIGGFDTELKTAQDWDFIIKSTKESPVTSVPEILTIFIKHPFERISTNPTRQISGRLHIMQKYHADYEQYPSLKFKPLAELAKFCYYNNDRIKAYSYLFKAFKTTKAVDNRLRVLKSILIYLPPVWLRHRLKKILSK